jgi:hypothetical protein
MFDEGKWSTTLMPALGDGLDRFYGLPLEVPPNFLDLTALPPLRLSTMPT